MSPGDRKLLRLFYRIMNRAVRACYRRDGHTDVEEVCSEMERDSDFTLENLLPQFGRQYMRILVQKRLKRLAMNNGHSQAVRAAAATAAAQNQRELDIENIEQFRGAPISISLEDRPGHVIYMPFEDTLREQRRLSLWLLDHSISADVNKRQAQARVTDFADHLADFYGDLPVKDLVERWTADGRPGAEAAGGMS